MATEMQSNVQPGHGSALHTRNGHHLKYILLPLLVSMIWGGTFIVVQRAVSLSGPFTFLALRFGIGTLILALFSYKRLRRITRLELISGSCIGVILFAAYALQTVGLQFMTSSKAAFITGLYVPFVTILSVLLLRQRPTLAALVGVLLSFLGLTLLSVNDQLTLTFGLGEALMLGCAVANALHVVSISKFAARSDALNQTIIQMGMTALLSVIAMPLAGERFVSPDWTVWLAALAMGLIATAFCIAVMNWVQKFLSSTQATLIYALEPVWAAIIGGVIGEPMSIPTIIGCGAIFLGMIVGELDLGRFKRRKSG
ncbi:threonine/homoserine efflux transporter RhtA [Thermosporothrix hazakensis]|jgi:drug/metabolite transporter (DMT)-like permease|uniref:Threonine/homoserine efflux transporter RhtA n=2 Tax=Thermosporothrix TaxID=768650 RepID=A0A326U3J5_THEHA|nr:DMT family transporter [Thermosporothrix hazakensis]PZW26659.1 threonine/homoserine efflux transporter RhtA [Thermosporothrix hazakensis]BBH89455.1 membrane protein [Thermosporothrix sp. COM3]GCE47639.1 membrane protein [Thermosporothrix hazakensis]